jgi:hypothetical protein
MLFNTCYGKSRKLIVKIEKKQAGNNEFLCLLSQGAKRDSELFKIIKALVNLTSALNAFIVKLLKPLPLSEDKESDSRRE